MKKIHTCFALLSISAFCLVPFTLAAQQKSSNNARYVETLTATLSQQVRDMQDENANLKIQITELNRKIAALQKEKETGENEIQQLKRQISQETAVRESQVKDILKQIKILAEAPVPVPVPVVPAASDKKKPGAADDVKYEEYTVAAGATLTVIAEAYNVTVQDIKKANGMKNDRLRVGQKLKIPVK